MPDYKIIKIPNLEQWIISAPKRAKRFHRNGSVCVFCPGNENELEDETYRIGGNPGKKWNIRVVRNKYPFAPIHDIVILTPEHVRKNSQISLLQRRLGIEAMMNRYNAYKNKGSVIIFGNSGKEAGESVHHPHAQIAVLPNSIKTAEPKLEKNINYWGENFRVGDFEIICPPYSQWPDEIWVVPLDRDKTFGQLSISEIGSLAYIWDRLIKIFEVRYSNKFAHNFYIYPYRDWYLRFIPRSKYAGGLELSTGIFVNTQNPRETMEFIKDHFSQEDEKIIRKSRERYAKGA